MTKAIKEVIPAMTSKTVHEYLTKIGLSGVYGGTVIELGCWLGGSAVPLLTGLKIAGYNKPFWAFDRWIANQEQAEKASGFGVELQNNQDTMPLFLDNVSKVYDNIQAFKGHLPETLENYDGGFIQICIFDAPKRNPVFIDCMKALLPHFVPGVTIVGLLDYYFYKEKTGLLREKLLAPVNFMNRYDRYFEKIQEWEDQSPVFFRYMNELKPEKVRG